MSRPVVQSSAPRPELFGYQPALDGLRGVAVAMVLLFHGGVSWMGGGYVGVSVFFTLSGFLITTLLLAEHRRTGRVSWKGFVARRARRLLPASLLCLLVVWLSSLFGAFESVPHLHRDVITAALQVANWNALAGSGSYTEMMSRALGVQSPLDHFWSLAIEEQFYWVWPLAVIALLRVARRPSRRLAVFVGLAVAGVVGARLIALQWGPDAAYWATPARLGELLVGAALGAACYTARGATGRGIDWRRWLDLVGVAGLAGVVWAAVDWPSNGGPAYEGWLGVFSLSSAAVILGLQGDGLLRRAFSVGPLVWLGRISYGVYVFHWPVFLLMTQRSVHVSGLPLLALRMAATLVVAVTSYVLIEQPIRRGRPASMSRTWRMIPLVGAVSVALVALVVAVSAQPRPSRAVGPGTTSPAESPSSSPVSVVATSSTTSTTQPPPNVPVTVLVIGDSTATALQHGLDVWSRQTDDRVVYSTAAVGCGLITDTVMLGDPGGEFGRDCKVALTESLDWLLHKKQPETALIMITLSDVMSRQWSDDEGMLTFTDPRFQERMLADYRAMADKLVVGGVVHIAWVAPPLPGDWWMGWGWETNFDPTAWTTLSTVMATVAAEYPDVVQIVHLDGWFTERGLDNDTSIRDDGIHLTKKGAVLVMDEYLGPVLLRLAAV